MSREEDLFHAALELASEERSALLDRECASDEPLRRRIEGLIASHQHGGSFLQKAALDQNTTAHGSTGSWQAHRPPGALSEGEGAVIDRYKLLEKIGEGGFGVVYMAQQEKPVRRRVALKIIKVGMDTKQVIGRFEAERQALAMMDHPNIAKVLDAGSTAPTDGGYPGRPYFVMELVRGQPITTFCDQNNLNTKERLRLFADVCRAIQHAHQKGIIHRDIKPTNVMVTWHEDRPVPKVIDFGVAKATQQRLTEKTVFTQYAQMIGTPTYMSPEQAKLSTDVDTRTDVYSLGVLLYELLAGSPPFNARELLALGYDEMRRQICEVDPPTPSVRMSTLKDVDLSTVAKQRQAAPDKLSRLIRGELDWIVMKSLEKDRRRRYSTAASFADDIQRFLDGDAVEAAAPSAWYRLRKLALRNRVAAMMVAVVALALVAGTLVSSIGLLQARLAQEQVKEQLTETQAARQKAEQNLYVSEISRAYTAYEEGSPSITNALLRSQESLYGDRFEWRLLHRMCEEGEALHTFHSHSDRVNDVAVSRHGVIASAGADKTFRLFDLNGREEIEQQTMPSEVVGVEFAPSGDVLAVIEQSNEVSFWNVAPLEELGRLHAEKLGTSERYRVDLEFLDDETIAAVRQPPDAPVHFWKWRSPDTPPTTIDESNGSSVSFSREGQLMSVGGPGLEFSFWRKVSDGTYQRSASIRHPHARHVVDTVCSPDGKYLATRDPVDVRIWDTKSLINAEAVNNEPKEPDAVFQTDAGSLAYSPDSRYLAVGNHGGNVEVWPGLPTWPPRERPLSIFRGHSGRVHGIAFSHDGRYIVTGSNDHTVRIWPGQIPAIGRDTITESEWVFGVDFSPDGKQLAAASFDGRVTVYDCETMERVLEEKRHNWQTLKVVFSPSGEWLASCAGVWRGNGGLATNGWVSLINLENRQKSYYVPELTEEVRGIDFAPDSNLLAIGDYNGVIQVWDATNQKQLVSCKSADVRNVCYSPDGTQLAVSTISGLDLRRSDTLELIASYGDDNTRMIAFSPDGKTLVYQKNSRIVKLLDVPDLTEKGTILGSTSRKWGVAFSPDGKSLVTSESQGMIRISNMDTGRDIVALAAHRGMVTGLAISPDGNMMASSGEDNTIRIWRASPTSGQRAELP